MSVSEESLINNWNQQQEIIASKVSLSDELIPAAQRTCDSVLSHIQYIGGVDISFAENDEAVVAVCILDAKSLAVLHTEVYQCHMQIPYIPGYLAFREIPPTLEALKAIKQKLPHLYPQVLFVDGNGILHPRGCGLACHLGVILDLPTLGVSKNMLVVDGMTKEWVMKRFETGKLHSLGNGERVNVVSLQSDSGTMYGWAALTGNATKNPIFISPGHKISLESALELTLHTSQHRIPEPTRQADLRGRQFINEKRRRQNKGYDQPDEDETKKKMLAI